MLLIIVIIQKYVTLVTSAISIHLLKDKLQLFYGFKYFCLDIKIIQDGLSYYEYDKPSNIEIILNISSYRNHNMTKYHISLSKRLISLLI